MSNIGYAVFGSPKGISVISNGIFKELNLDKSLYLNSSHIVLNKGEQVLMVRRIPTNLQDLDTKDGLLVVLYEHALQHGENRPGGFVGSAICFTKQIPNSEKMISGLFYLFSKMKSNVDADNRFKSIDSSSWDINLPDAGKEFGMFEKNHLQFLPLINIKANYAIKLHSIEKEAPILLSHLCLNHLYHNIDYVYASDNDNVIKKTATNSISILDFNTLFNYTKHLSYYTNKITKDTEQLRLIKSEGTTLKNQILTGKNELTNIINSINRNKNELNKIEQEAYKAKESYKKAENEKRDKERELAELKRLVKNKISPDGDKLKEYEVFIAEIASKIEKYSSFNFKNSHIDNDVEKNQFKVNTYINNLPTRKAKARKRNTIILGTLLLLLLTFLGLFVFKTIALNTSITQVKEMTEKNNQYITSSTKVKAGTKERNLLLSNVIKYQKGSINADFKKFKKHTKTLLNNLLNNQYEKGSSELAFIENYSWEFWEFDYKNDTLVKQLNLNNSNYFINLNHPIKPLNKIVTSSKTSNMDELLTNYLKQNNDLYQNLPKAVINDKTLLKDHFKWLIEKANSKKIQDLTEKEKIGLPYFQK